MWSYTKWQNVSSLLYFTKDENQSDSWFELLFEFKHIPNPKPLKTWQLKVAFSKLSRLCHVRLSSRRAEICCRCSCDVYECSESSVHFSLKILAAEKQGMAVVQHLTSHPLCFITQRLTWCHCVCIWCNQFAFADVTNGVMLCVNAGTVWEMIQFRSAGFDGLCTDVFEAAADSESSHMLKYFKYISEHTRCFIQVHFLNRQVLQNAKTFSLIVRRHTCCTKSVCVCVCVCVSHWYCSLQSNRIALIQQLWCYKTSQQFSLTPTSLWIIVSNTSLHRSKHVLASS